MLKSIVQFSPVRGLWTSPTLNNVNVETPVDFPEGKMGPIYYILKTLQALLSLQ